MVGLIKAIDYCDYEVRREKLLNKTLRSGNFWMTTVDFKHGAVIGGAGRIRSHTIVSAPVYSINGIDV